MFYRGEQHDERQGNTLLFQRKMWEAKTTTRFCNKNVRGFPERQATLLTNSHHASRSKLLPRLVQRTCMVRAATLWFTLDIQSSNPFWSRNRTEREHVLLRPGDAVEGAPTRSVCSQDRSWMCITGFYGNRDIDSHTNLHLQLDSS